MLSMSLASRFNSSARFTHKLGDDAGYVNLAGLYNPKSKNGNRYTVRGFYINRKSKFGEAPVAVLDNEYCNLPKHLLDSVTDICGDPEAVEAVNAGKFGMEIYTYTSKEGNTCYSVTWVDL